MAIQKVYPSLVCANCGNELETIEPETVHVFILRVEPCKHCAAQQRVPTRGPQSALNAINDTARNRPDLI